MPKPNPALIDYLESNPDASDVALSPEAQVRNRRARRIDSAGAAVRNTPPRTTPPRAPLNPFDENLQPPYDVTPARRVRLAEALDPNPELAEPAPPAPEEPVRGFAPPDADMPVRRALDPTEEWKAAEARSAERWARGEPSVADRIFLLVFGRRSAVDRIQEENDQLRDEIAERR